MFAIDDFTENNGATVAIPGSHLWGEDRVPRPEDQRIKAVMPAGSCILFLGNLWHGGGENCSGSDRLALTAQYCEPWACTQENYFLSVSRCRVGLTHPVMQDSQVEAHDHPVSQGSGPLEIRQSFVIPAVVGIGDPTADIQCLVFRAVFDLVTAPASRRLPIETPPRRVSSANISISPKRAPLPAIRI